MLIQSCLILILMCALLNYICFKRKSGGEDGADQSFWENKKFKISKKSKIQDDRRRRESFVNFQLLRTRHGFLRMNIKLNTLNFCTYMNECIANFRDSSTVSTITKPVCYFYNYKK